MLIITDEKGKEITRLEPQQGTYHKLKELSTKHPMLIVNRLVGDYQHVPTYVVVQQKIFIGLEDTVNFLEEAFGTDASKIIS